MDEKHVNIMAATTVIRSHDAVHKQQIRPLKDMFMESSIVLRSQQGKLG